MRSGFPIQTGVPQTGVRRPRVVIVGAGFGGLSAAKALRHADVDVVLIDRRNYHTFVPLLYEVATAGLEADDIAQPVRAIIRGSSNLTFRMASVERVDLAAKAVLTGAGAVAFDYLVLAAGSTTNFFAVRGTEHALGLKDLDQANAVRNRVLRSFEHATIEHDSDERKALMTVVVVGGGPTGVELAGALAELKRHVLPRDYPDLDLDGARVILLEATAQLLSAFPKKLQRRGREQLADLGVDVRLDAAVAELTADGVTLDDGERIASKNIVWVAGVRGEHLAGTLGVTLRGGGRIVVEPTLQVPDHPSVYAIGDGAYLEAPDGKPYPMLAQAAMQQGALAAQNIVRTMAGQRPERFRYRDRGTMATIGRQKAIAHVFGLQFSGFFAWLLWLSVHLVALIGLRNRALVLINWVWNYFRYDRANRLVTDRLPNEAEPRAASEQSGEAGEHR